VGKECRCQAKTLTMAEHGVLLVVVPLVKAQVRPAQAHEVGEGAQREQASMLAVGR